MPINSKQKGSRFERVVAGLFKAEGYSGARRSQQYAGINNDADVVGVPRIHIECKHVERLNIYDAMAQAKRDKRENELPVVIHKKNNCNVLVTMEFDDWINLYREWECSMNEVKTPNHLISKEDLIHAIQLHKDEWGSFMDGHDMAQEIIYIIEDAEEWG